MTAQARYEDHIAEFARESGVRIGVSVWRSHNESSVGYCQDELFPLASVAKFLTAVAALKRQEQGDINHAVDLTSLVMATISHHDHEATTALTALCGGTEEINRTLASAGFHSLSVVADHTRPDNTGNTHDLTSLLHQLSEGCLLPADHTDLILRALAQQSDPDGLRSGLPPGVHWLHMTGGLDDVCTDIGILRCKHGVLVCSVFTQGSVPWRQLEAIVGRIGAVTYEYCCEQHHQEAQCDALSMARGLPLRSRSYL